MKTFWTIKNATADSAELLLYGPIASETWFEDEVSPKQFDTDLKALGAISTLTVRIFSPGGDVFAGQAIADILMRHPAEKIGIVDGLCASAATFPFVACDRRIMPSNAVLLVHNPWVMLAGTATDMRKMADSLDVARETMLALYEARTGLERDELIEIMDADQYMTAEDAVAKGFATEIEAAMPAAASLRGGQLIVNGYGIAVDRLPAMPFTAVARLLESREAPAPEPPAGIDAARRRELYLRTL